MTRWVLEITDGLRQHEDQDGHEEAVDREPGELGLADDGDHHLAGEQARNECSDETDRELQAADAAGCEIAAYDVEERLAENRKT